MERDQGDVHGGVIASHDLVGLGFNDFVLGHLKHSEMEVGRWRERSACDCEH